MAYTTPPTFVSGDPLPAAELNVLGDDIKYLYGVTQGVTFSGANVAHSGSQSIPSGTDTDVTLATEAWDYGAWWSSGVSFTVPAGAIPAGFTTIACLVVATIRFVASGTGGRSIKLLVNGSVTDTLTGTSDAAENTVIQLTAFPVVAAGDTIKMQARQTSGGSLSLDAGRLTVVRYAPAA
jgi:hypothetical protein